jgi:hypothetical protein
VAEGHGGDQFAVLAACAIQTSRILLGTSITSVFVRTAPTIAVTAATLDELTGGRFILGVGSSGQTRLRGESPATPTRLCRLLSRPYSLCLPTGRRAGPEGRELDPIPGDSRLLARQLARKVVNALVEIALDPACPQSREEYLKGLR